MLYLGEFCSWHLAKISHFAASMDSWPHTPASPWIIGFFSVEELLSLEAAMSTGRGSGSFKQGARLHIVPSLALGGEEVDRSLWVHRLFDYFAGACV